MTKSKLMTLIRNWALLVEFDIPDGHIEMLSGLLIEQIQAEEMQATSTVVKFLESLMEKK